MDNLIEKQVIIDGLKINYFRSENLHDKHALVFLHGWQSEGNHLKSIFMECDNYVAIDLPGFGKSDEPRGIWGVNEYAWFLKSFIKKLGLEDIILIGHSFGGSVIIKFIGNGGKAEKIILVASAGIRKRSSRIKAYGLLASVLKFVFYIPVISSLKCKAQEFAYKFIGSEDYLEAGNLIGSYKKIISEDLESDMKRINVPAFLIWGDNDEATPLEDAREMRVMIKDSELHVIKNAGHFVFLDKPEEFNKLFALLC